MERQYLAQIRDTDLRESLHWGSRSCWRSQTARISCSVAIKMAGWTRT